MKIFLDTNVLLDYYLDREPNATAAASLLELTRRNVVVAAISGVSVTNIYYLLHDVNKKANVERALGFLCDLLEVVPTSKAVIQVALKDNGLITRLSRNNPA